MADIAKITLKGESEAKNFIDEALRGDIAYEELSTTVSKTGGYVAGDHLIYLGQYYEVVADIAQGGTIVTSGAGQNVEEREVGDEIKKNKTQVVAQIQTLTNNVNVNGSKNKLYLDLERLISDNTGGTWNNNKYTYRGGEFTINEDSITFGGTPTNVASIYFMLTNDEIPPEKYVLSGLADCTNIMWGGVNLFKDGVSVQTFNINSKNNTEIDCSSYTYDTVRVEIKRNANNVAMSGTANVMLCLKSDWDLDNTFAPYSKSNHQLTQDSVTWDDLSKVGAVNRLPNTATATAKITHGITFTVNDDRTVDVSGTGDAEGTNPYLQISQFTLPKGTYKLCGCPINQSLRTAWLFLRTTSGTQVGNDIGDGLVFTVGDETVEYEVRLYVYNAATNLDLTFKPMITDPSYNGPYVPPAKTNKQLTDDTASAIANVPNGAINLAKPVSAGTTTVSNVEFVIDSEGKVTANGTASANIRFDIAEVTLKAGRTYKICEPSSLQARRPFYPETCRCYARIKSSGTWVLQNNGFKGSYTPTEDVVVSVGIAIESGNQVTDEVFAPMLVLYGTDVGDTFYPYAKTNKELTEDVTRLDGEVIKIVAGGIINANSSRSFTCTDYEGYRLSIYSIGGNSIGMIVLFGKHPSVSDVRFSKFNCEDRNPDAPQISVSGSTLTITTTTFNCYFVIERILGT